jgi:hypothetical protein
MIRIISAGFTIQGFLLALVVGHRDGYSVLWWECIVAGFCGLAVLALVTFIEKEQSHEPPG